MPAFEPGAVCRQPDGATTRSGAEEVELPAGRPSSV